MHLRVLEWVKNCMPFRCNDVLRNRARRFFEYDRTNHCHTHDLTISRLCGTYDYSLIVLKKESISTKVKMSHLPWPRLSSRHLEADFRWLATAHLTLEASLHKCCVGSVGLQATELTMHDVWIRLCRAGVVLGTPLNAHIILSYQTAHLGFSNYNRRSLCSGIRRWQHFRSWSHTYYSY